MAHIDDTWFYINQMGMFQDNGAQRTPISNNIQNQFYNNQNTGIQPPYLGSAIGETYMCDYLVSVGTITDPFVGRQMKNTLIKYDFLKNQKDRPSKNIY